ncbi:MAG: hypothetical protein IJJ72_03090 [Bacteroidales bacterium]|nr:hypothetical protein [Bacteroidales bacterium]
MLLRSFVIPLLVLSICFGCNNPNSVNTHTSLPFVLVSQNKLYISNPIFAFKYNRHNDENALFVGNQKDLASLYPVSAGESFFYTCAPFVTDICSYNDSMVYFKFKAGIHANTFKKTYVWQYNSIPDSFIWPTDFDDVEFCTDRYYKLFLTWDESSYDFKRMMRCATRSKTEAISTEWRTFFSTKDTSSWRTVIHDYKELQTLHRIKHKSRFLNWQSYYSYGKKELRSNGMRKSDTFVDTTLSYLCFDSLFIYVPHTDEHRQYLFSPEIVTRQFDYPFFQGGLNCYALQLMSCVALDSVSERVYQDTAGTIYRVPEQFNQKQFVIVMRMDTDRKEYYLSTILDPVLEEKVLSETIDFDSIIVTETDEYSIFINGNQLIKEWLKNRTSEAYH